MRSPAFAELRWKCTNSAETAVQLEDEEFERQPPANPSAFRPLPAAQLPLEADFVAENSMGAERRQQPPGAGSQRPQMLQYQSPMSPMP